MLGNFKRIDVEFYNQMTRKQHRFIANSWEELDKIEDKFNELLSKKEEHWEFWKKFKEKVIVCDCGKEVVCSNFTNTCYCGADYNFSGTRLAPRSQWGEETGEHWSDITK